jgi:hypothetical protein
MNRFLNWWNVANPAERYCALFGAVLVLVGVLGYFEKGGTDFGAGDAVASSKDLSSIHVNGWHNLFHLLTGLFALLVLHPRVPIRPALFVLGFGLLYSLLAIYGFNRGEGVVAFGLVPLRFGNDAVHVVLGPLAVSAGLATRASPQAITPR